MNKKTVPIGVFLIVICIILVVLPAVSIWFLNTAAIVEDTLERFHQQLDQTSLQAYSLIQDTYDWGQEKVNSDLILADYVLSSYGRPQLDYTETMEIEATDQITKESKIIQIPELLSGANKIAGDFTIVDEVKSLVGGTATIFQVIPDGLLRISTNVLKLDGERAVGTYIPQSSPVYKTVMKGETFYGRAYVVNAWYMTAYKPFFNDGNEVIGVIYVGVKEEIYQQQVLSQLGDIRIGKSGYLYILDSEGNYVLSENQKRNGENVWDTTDMDGVPVIQEIIKTAQNSEKGVSAEYNYFWKNPEDQKAREKFSGVMYFEAWDWVVVTSAYKDDAYKIIEENIKQITLLGSIAIMLGIIIAVIMSRRISRPLIRMGTIVDQISHKDLTAPEDIKTIFREFFILTANIRNELLPSLHKVFKSIQSLLEDGVRVSETLDGSTSQTRQVTDDIVEKSSAVLKQLKDLDVQIKDTDSSILHINDTLTILSDKVTSQSASVSQTSTAIEEMAASINTVARIAKEKQKSSNNLIAITADGSEKVNNTSESILKISKSIGDILNLTKVINGIAAQTNLLAMNAAIEAAHAGEAGKGFAVVADEIRKLSASTSVNAKSISTTLKTVVQHIEESSDSSKIARKSFDDISTEVNYFVDAFVEITNSTSEISAGSEEMLNAVEELNSNTLEIRELSKNIKESSHEIVISLRTIKNVSFNTIEAFNLVEADTKEIQAANDHIQKLSQENRNNLNELNNEIELFKL